MPEINFTKAGIILCLGLLGHGSLLAESWELRAMDENIVGSREILDGKIDDAIELLEQARENTRREDSGVLGNLCVAHALKLEYAKALRYCSRAIHSTEADPMTYNNRGAVRAAMGDERGALRDFWQAGCTSTCGSSCVEDDNPARSVAQRNLQRLRLISPALYNNQELRFQARL